MTSILTLLETELNVVVNFLRKVVTRQGHAAATVRFIDILVKEDLITHRPNSEIDLGSLLEPAEIP